jgi:hypothetical protein
MERIQRSATIRADGPPLRLQVTLGDGLRGSCTAHILAGSAHTHTLQVEVDGSAVAVPIEALLVDDAHIDWLVIVFGPGEDAPYHLLLDLLQGEASALERPVRLSGSAPARKATSLQGTIRPKAAR